MTRNNADFHGSLFHISPPDNRASIELHGLKMHSSWGEDIDEQGNPVEAHGVYAADAPATEYREGDIWAISGVPSQSGEDQFIRHDVAPENLKRVGHTTDYGDVHWHKEEDCND